VYLLRPTPASLLIEDGAYALSQIVRFTGHCTGPYTVAQHSCHCHDVAPAEFRKSALLHDLQEGWISDCSKPLKECLPQYQEIEQRFERLISRKWKIPFPMSAVVKEIDNRMLVTEMRDLMHKADYKCYPFQPYDMKMKVWSHAKAYREFMRRYEELKVKA